MPRSPLLTRERAAAFGFWGLAILVSGLFLWLLVDVVARGHGGLSPEFLVAAPRSAGKAGGIGPILVSTALILLVCLAVSGPVGIGTAIYLSEIGARGGRTGRLVRRSLDALAAVPSIVFGLFGMVLFCQVLGLGFSILSGGLTLACMVLPVLIRTTEVGLRSVPEGLRQGAAAVALSRTTTLRRLILPAAAPALVAGLVLGLGRAVAETAALIFTSGSVDRLPGSLADSGRAISVHIYELAMLVPGGDSNAYASAVVLVVLLLVINQVASSLTTRLLGGGQRPA